VCADMCVSAGKAGLGGGEQLVAVASLVCDIHGRISGCLPWIFGREWKNNAQIRVNMLYALWNLVSMIDSKFYMKDLPVPATF